MEETKLREDGNKLFKAGDNKGAIGCYSKAIKLTANKEQLAILYRNRSACHLKLENFSQAVSDSTKAIETDQKDVKALYRRSLALERLGRIDQAFHDMQRCTALEPKNDSFIEALRNLRARIQEQLHMQFSTDQRVQQMFDILLGDADMEKKEKAAQNLVVLGRDEAGAELIFRGHGLQLLQRLLVAPQSLLRLAALRTISCLCCGHRARATAVLREISVDKVCGFMASEEEEISLAACNVLQNAFEALTGSKDKSDYIKKEQAVLTDVSKDINIIIHCLLEMLVDRKVSTNGRDNALTLLIQNIPCKTLKEQDNSKTLKVVKTGLKRILRVVGSIPELPTNIPLTDATRMRTSVLLHRLYDDLRDDSQRDVYHSACEGLITEFFSSQKMEETLQAVQTISGLLQGPYEVGNRLLANKGVMETMVALANSQEELHQLIAVEALLMAASKASRASFITNNAISLLKTAYKQASSDKIKIRALVGLCKLGSAGGTDYSLRQFTEGSTEKLAHQCRKWLCSGKTDNATKRWAIEGLAYLTLDADVKDDFVEDKDAIHAMLELAKAKDQPVLYAVASVLVNCTNSYEQKEKVPEMVELAKYAKQHVPEEHPKDKQDFVEKRVKKLLQAAVVSALVCMVRADSAVLTNSNKELLSRVFLALSENPKDRGTIVSEGGGKALIPLALEGTDEGKIKAAQALARLAVNSNPQIVFHGEMIYELVRPLVSLLNEELSAVQNFEGLQALTNLAAGNDKLRQKILKEKALSLIEHYMFEQHEHIQRAATECMCNMAGCLEVQKKFIAEGNDKLKLVVLLCGEDDEQVQKAAAGTLAILTSEQESLCIKTTKVIKKI
uniref:protein unc-45 homolog B-like n=1 Tax=Myxine glutinosa TaxID=7769 RepID=UPI00358F9374